MGRENYDLEVEEEEVPEEEHDDEAQAEYEREKAEKKEELRHQRQFENLASVVKNEDLSARYYFYPTWRSQIFPLIGFFLMSYLCIVASRSEFLDWTVIQGKLFTTGSRVYFLHLPLLSLLPAFLIGRVLFFMYNARYIIDNKGVEAQIGLVSLSLRQPRLRYEDIRGVEPKQTLLERILGIGNVLIGSAMTFEVEIVMEGVTSPRAIQLLIGNERDRRLRTLGAAAQSPVHLSGD